MDTKDYISMFEQSSEMLAVIDTKFNIIDVSNAFLKGTKTKRENIIGKDIFHVFPSNPNDLEANSEGKIRASFNRVLKNKTNDIISVIKYDIPKPESEGGGYELKYWRPHHYPILDELNNVKYIMQKVEDVTENEELIKQLEFEKKALKQLEDSEKRYNMMLLRSPFGFAVLKGKNMVITLANDSVKEFWGKGKDIEGKPLLEVLPEIKDSEFPGLLNSVYTTGVPYYGEELLAKIVRNEKLENVYFNFVYQPYLEADETISGVTVIAYEVTAQVIVKQALADQREAEKKAIKRIEESNKRYHTMLMQSPFAFSIMKGKDMVVTVANDLMKEFWGKGTDVEGKTLLQVLPELKDQPFPAMIDKVFTTGIPIYANEMLAQLKHNNKLEDKYFNIVYQPHYEADESISGVTTIAHDVTSQVTVKKTLEALYEAEKIAVRKIQASEERFRQLVLQAPVAICVMLGEEFVIETINQKMGDIWGRTIAEAINKPVFELLPEVIIQGYKELLESVYKTGERYVSEESLVNFNRNGKLENVFVKFVYEPFRNSEGAVSGVMCLGHEITEQVNVRKKIEKNEQRFQGAIAAVQGILWTNSASGEMIGEQLAWASLTGQSYQEYQGFGWANAIHPDDAQPTIDAWNEAVSEGKNFIFEHRVRLKNGNWGNFSVRGIPSLDTEGHIMEWIGVHTDITEQRQTENALKNAILQQKEAISKAETAAQIAEDAVKAKQQFLSNMSHEIRTPMNSIIGFTNVVLKTNLNIKQKEYINAIKVSGDALLVLINDILDLAKVDAGKMTFEQIPFNLISSISSMIQVFENKLQEKNLNLVSEYDLTIPEVLNGDPMRLRQIILNLISNAVKFTAKGKITLSVCLLKEDTENITLEFAVKDTGIGISKNKIEHVFDDFRQVSDENTRLYGGTGLGLAIVKQLVESQGGSVNVQSKIDVGSTFSFILNFKKVTTTMSSSSSSSSLTPPPLSIKNVKVLIVEDIALNQLLMKTILIDFGFDYDFANNGKIAIEKLEKNNYDIILMDLQMPEMNGFEATDYIRNKMNSQIPIIALTADVTTVDVEKCKAFGMNDYISKPIDENLLYIKIVKYLNKQN